jgi:ribosomal protein L15
MHCTGAFGKYGFTSPQSLKRNENVINVAKLEELASKLTTETENSQQWT